MKPTKKTGRELEGEGNARLVLSVSPDELHLAAAVFCFVHRECEAAHACQEGDIVWLWCGLCGESRVYAVSEPDFEPSTLIRPLFRKPPLDEPDPPPEGMAF